MEEATRGAVDRGRGSDPAIASGSSDFSSEEEAPRSVRWLRLVTDSATCGSWLLLLSQILPLGLCVGPMMQERDWKRVLATLTDGSSAPSGWLLAGRSPSSLRPAAPPPPVSSASPVSGIRKVYDNSGLRPLAAQALFFLLLPSRLSLPCAALCDASPISACVRNASRGAPANSRPPRSPPLAASAAPPHRPDEWRHQRGRAAIVPPSAAGRVHGWLPPPVSAQVPGASVTRGFFLPPHLSAAAAICAILHFVVLAAPRPVWLLSAPGACINEARNSAHAGRRRQVQCLSNKSPIILLIILVIIVLIIFLLRFIKYWRWFAAITDNAWCSTQPTAAINTTTEYFQIWMRKQLITECKRLRCIGNRDDPVWELEDGPQEYLKYLNARHDTRFQAHQGRSSSSSGCDMSIAFKPSRMQVWFWCVSRVCQVLGRDLFACVSQSLTESLVQ
eukprot:GHVT01019162.1.p1 GENE.GHVT01019162.1~~GHVT01019162.1.p1  ORF type:complete len:447 (-),score=71.92 GHVT01019162.1:590-1930(-)